MKSMVLVSLAASTLSILPFITQPLTIGVAIIMATLFLCLLIACYIRSWYAYVLFLIYVGGLLVIFAYVIALSPNTIFKAEVLTPIVFFSSFGILFMSSYTQLWVSFSNFVSPESGYSFIFLKECGRELVSPFSISILVGLACVLLINLIVVVKICFYQRASLRPFKRAYAFTNSKNPSCTETC